MDMEDEHVISCPFSETASVAPFLVVSVSVPNDFIYDRLVTTSKNVSQFDPARMLEVYAYPRVRTAIYAIF